MLRNIRLKYSLLKVTNRNTLLDSPLGCVIYERSSCNIEQRFVTFFGNSNILLTTNYKNTCLSVILEFCLSSVVTSSKAGVGCRRAADYDRQRQVTDDKQTTNRR